MPILSLIYGTIKEAIAKKVLLSIFVIFSAVIIIMLLVINLDPVEVLPQLMGNDPNFDFNTFVLWFEVQMISQFPFFIIMTLFIVMTSSFIPSMLEKGTVELILSKPVSRSEIILGKYAGGVIIVFSALTYLITIIWLIISFKTGVWHFSFLTSILWYTFIFAVLYSLIIFTALITKSTVLTLIFNMFLLFPITGLLSLREGVYSLINNKAVEFILDFIYYLLPKPWDLRTMAVEIIEGKFSAAQGILIAYQPLITSIIFIITILSLSIYYFNKKDY